MRRNESCSSPLSSSSAPQESEIQLPGGSHFDPEDWELIEHFLLRRCLGHRPSPDIIPDIQEPYQHPSTLKRPFKHAVDNESYFFTKFQQKSDSDPRKIRSINGGFWKTTSEHKPVQHEMKTVGHKKRFTFYEVDDDKGHKKTDWIMHEYTMDESTLDGKLMLEDYVLCKLYNNKKSSSDSPNVRSDPPCPSSPDITSSRVQRQDEFYYDNGVSFGPQSNNVDTPKVVWQAVTIPDILMINDDNQVQHSDQLSGASASSAPYSSTQDMSSLGILQKEVERCNGAAYSVLPQFSHGMPSPYTSQVMEVDQTMMNVDPLVQNCFQLSDAELSSATYSSSQNMASLEMHPATAYCNQAIPLVQNRFQLSDAELSSATYSSSQNMASLEMHPATAYCNQAIPLVQNRFQLSDAELSSATYSSSQNMASLEMHPATAYCNQAIPSTTQWDSLEMMEVSGRILNNEGQLVQFPITQLENTPQSNIPSHIFTRQEELDGTKSIMNEGHPQQRTPQQQEDMSLAYMSYPNDYMEQDGFQSWQHLLSEDYPHQLEDIFGAYTPQEALQTFQVEFLNEDYSRSYALWHEENIQPEHHLDE